MKKLNTKLAVMGIIAGTLILYLAASVILRQDSRQERADSSSQKTAGVSAKHAPDGFDSLNGEAGAPVADEMKSGVRSAASQSYSYADAYPDKVLTNLKIPSLDEKIVRTANLEIQVKEGGFDSGYERAMAIARSAGGYVGQSKSRATNDSIASGEIIMKIPVRDFETVLSGLKRLGKVKAIDISSEDVSEEYVDLESRLKHWRAQEVVMLELMRKAGSINESITIQNSLSQIQMEIERISGRLKFLENRTSYATISLYMAEPQVVVRADRWGFKAAMHNSIQASAKVLISLIMLAGYVLPLALLYGIGYAIYRPIVNARRRQATL